jgi:hypothetical protein
MDRREHLLVVAFCMMAAARVFVFAAAFPLFNNVDEQAHFDIVMKYSHGQVPRGMEPVSVESAQVFALCSSPEYFSTPERFPGGQFPPPLWTRPRYEVQAELQQTVATWQGLRNPECFQAPLYYATAGAWKRLGEWSGQRECFLAFWIRFLNVPLVALLVWLGHIGARQAFPDNRFARVAVVALLASLPQDTFYGVDNDVLSPLCFGAVFVCVTRWLQAGTPTPALAVATGLAMAATFLVKTSNVPPLAVAGAALVLDVLGRARHGAQRNSRRALVMLAVAAVVPMGLWMLRSWIVFGDVIASAKEIEVVGWSPKPFAAWWAHPLFSPAGLWKFTKELTTRFWRGEFAWHGEAVASPAADAFYVASSLVFPGLAVSAMVPARPAAKRQSSRVFWFGLATIAASVALLVHVSIAFDFGDHFYPSRGNPFLTSGRLVSGTVIPFLLLYVYGVDCVLARAKSWQKYGLLAAIVSLLTATEVIATGPVFASRYNWFHLW